MGKVIIPKKLKIGAHEYEVVFPHKFSERDGWVGLHDTLTRRILIANVDFGGKDRPFSEICRTFFHEVLHAINKIYCAGKIGSDMEEEDLIEAIAEGLTQLYLDNEMPYEDE